MKLIRQIILLIFLLGVASACVQTSAQAPEAAPPVSETPVAAETPTPEAAATSGTAPAAADPTQAENAVLIWEGDPLADDNLAECRRLQLAADGQALLGACGEAGTVVEPFAFQEEQWTDMLNRFAPFERETEQGRLVFRGQGQVSSPAWERALDSWARFTYLESASGRAGAANRTIMSWFLGEVPDQPGACRHLVVLSHGYAYSNITPCEGGDVKETVGGWVETAEWEQLDTWLYNQAPVYQDNNYFSGQSSAEMSEAEVAELARWAKTVYAQVRDIPVEELE